MCARCAPGLDQRATLWCRKHQPPLHVDVVGWQTDPRLQHPGRADAPAAATEGRSTLDRALLPTAMGQVAALDWTEEGRWRAVDEVLMLSAWCRAQPRPERLRTMAPSVLVSRYVHERVMGWRPVGRRRTVVRRPTTAETWVRRLALAVPRLQALERSRHLRSLLGGYRALAPAPAAVERDREQEWLAAMADAATQVTQHPSPVAAATWLALELGRQALRPKTAVRACMAHATRERQANGDVVVGVLLDKDNAKGRVPAVRRRRVKASRLLDRVVSLLPLPDDAYAAVVAARKAHLAAHGVRQTYVARRDAGARIEREMDPTRAGAALNHKPGSRSTAVYTNTVTPTALLEPLARPTRPAHARTSR